MINDKSKKYRMLQILFIANLVLTMSRTSLLGAIILYVLYMWYAKKLTKKKVIIGILGVFIGIIIITIMNIKVEEFSKVFQRLFVRSETVTTETGRIKLWLNALEISKNNIFTGIGRFKAVELNMTLYDSSLNQFHNLYLETLVAYGIVGITGLMYFIVKIIKKVKKIETDEKSVILAGMYVFLFVSCFESTCRFSIGYVDTITMIYFFTMPTLYLNIKNEKKGKQ